MTVRTNPGEVKGIIEVDSTINLTPFIKVASIVVDRLADADEDEVHTDESLKVIETWLAAHFYSHRDQRLAEERKGRAGARYQGRTDMGLKSTQYGQAAIDLDPTGYLAGLGQSNTTVEAIWGGSEYEDAADYLP